MLPKIQHMMYDVVVPSTKEKIKIRSMTAREEKILLTVKEGSSADEPTDNSNLVAAISQVVNNCIIFPMNFDIDHLAIFDVEYIFIKLRAVSVSNIAKTSYIDNEDQQTYQFGVDLEKVEIKFPANSVPQIVVDDDITMTMKYPSASLYRDEHFLNLVGEEMFEYLVCKTVDSVTSKISGTEQFASVNIDEQKEFLNNLPISAYDKIRDFLSNLPHLFYELEYKNKEDHDRKITLTSLSDFFILA